MLGQLISTNDALVTCNPFCLAKTIHARLREIRAPEEVAFFQDDKIADFMRTHFAYIENLGGKLYYPIVQKYMELGLIAQTIRLMNKSVVRGNVEFSEAYAP